jgi:phosphoribosylformylglycinamidine synthase
MTSTLQTFSELTKTIPLREAGDPDLERISKEGLLSLTLDEMKVIQSHYQSLGRDPRDIELETIAQTWSEHCYHKTFRGQFTYSESQLNNETPLAKEGPKNYSNLLKETVMRVTSELNMPWCLSVFKDNAGVIAFDDTDAVAFKVETHNHPSALEPYGGAGTGVGGVIRDILGVGLGAKPVLNTDVFCFGPLNTPNEKLPEGVHPPRRIAHGVIAGVRDYGNRMGIPTSNGSIYFDSGYIGNPLVFCGTVGLLPKSAIQKTVQPGDLVVAMGGRTGRDGIHGATFSSVTLEKGISSSVVQIGHAIMEKKTMDVLLAARVKKLFRAITDCGAGGFSSAVGELGKDTGVSVDLEKAPLKYSGLLPWEIWLSESQERMVLAVPPENWAALRTLCRDEDVEATVIGEFTADKKLTIKFQGSVIGELSMDFLHDGLPQMKFDAVWNADEHKKKYRLDDILADVQNPAEKTLDKSDILGTIQSLLSHPVIASKESVVRQYDHEVQGGSVIKPFMGIEHDGPTDACVFRPKLSSWKGVAVSNGLNPEIGKWDPYLMALMAVDEAYRNLICIGGHLQEAAILDNFCWGDSKNSHDLAALVRASEGAREAASAYQLPFISGKDSFNNTWKTPDGKVHSIPPTLLISAIGVLEDVRTCLSPSLKSPDNLIYLVGTTQKEMAGSIAAKLWKNDTDSFPTFNLTENKSRYKKLQAAIRHRLVLSCHDLSEGGFLVALAEMAFGGSVGVKFDFVKKDLDLLTYLFSETPSRFLVEISPENKNNFEMTMGAGAIEFIGKTIKKPNITIEDNGQIILDEPVKNLKSIWKNSLKSL